MKTVFILALLAWATSLSAQHHHPTQLVSPFSKSLEKAYLSLQSSLAADDLNGAHESALAYISAFEKSTARLNVEALTQHAEAIAQANDIAAARASFKTLSSQATMLFDYLASSDSSPLYLVRCSMAFDGAGAEWLQNTQTISNPYYGSSMANCGSIVRRIGSTAPATASSSCCASQENHEASCEHLNSPSCCSQ
ncbi:DUF3347 domain-containing protein [Pelagicoccus enzymogenes]|uniref:DUF3347 domain-containing protein n=1 Tax=Pelagicoccus enzymogenes TaxID=2773457 RepID=UPI00281073E4|nr:DUF3347 domain-containing protein [Pelagicoccus enzymogenes]MDQ8198987.1 DUF3347 domain-containing protein [Pelagicoccus enzymogenes]